MLLGYVVIAMLVVFIDALFSAYARRRFRLWASLLGALLWPCEIVIIVIGVAWKTRHMPDFKGDWLK